MAADGMEHAKQRRLSVEQPGRDSSVSEMGEEILVAFGVDANFAPHLAVTITSIVSNAPGAKFRFLVINDGFPTEERTGVESCAPGQTFQWEEVSDTDILSQPGYIHISRAALFRLMIPQFAPQTARRAIYLDVDLVVLGDIRELANADMGASAIGAVFDPDMDADLFADENGLPRIRLGYFNSGVLLLDLKKIREEHTFRDALDVVLAGKALLRYGDQCALNIVFWGRWARLDPVWNVQRRMAMRKNWEPATATAEEMQRHRRPRLIHYTTAEKPWRGGTYHPYTWSYYKYLRKTPFWSAVSRKAGRSFIQHLKDFVRANLLLTTLRR